MAHHHDNSAFNRLVDRLNRFPQGAPATPLLFSILRMLFSEEEAGLVASLPIRPFRAEDAARAWSKPVAESRAVLETLAARALLLDLEQDGEQIYCLPPPMAGFFEFAFMRVRTDIDQKALAELFEQYISIEDDFMRDLFVRGETGLGRVFVQETALDEASRLEVLDWEKASHIIDTATARAVGMCYCRHKKEHMGTNCGAPMDICMTFNSAAHSLIKHGHAREVGREECLDLLRLAGDEGLVQFGENNREGVNFICNCCGCCCEALGAVKRFGIVRTIHSGHIISMDENACTGCGKCARICPVGALRAADAGKPANAGPVRGKKVPALHEDICLGCGVCVRPCPSGALRLKRRPGRTITPLNTSHRLVLMAAERGTLQNLIFDNQVLFSHRLAAAVLGAVLKLPPVARSLAQKQLKSRYVENLMARM